MPAPLTNDQRNTIVALHAAGHTRNQIAREAGISASSVSRICKAEGLNFDRTATAAATRAKVVDAKARRAELAELLLDDAFRLRAQLWRPARLVNFGGKDNTLAEVTLDEPQFGDKRNIMNAVAIAVQRHEALVKMDTDNGNGAVVNMLTSLAEKLGVTDA